MWGSQHQFLPLPLQETSCTTLKGSDTESCESDGTTENWRRGYRLPWALLSAWGPSVNKENFLRLDPGAHKDSRNLAEGWEICISSALFSNENTTESSLLCWPHAWPCAAPKSHLCLGESFTSWSPKLLVDDTPLLIITLVFTSPWI